MERDQGTILKEVRAALECETRVNLHRYPVHLSFSAGDLVVGGVIPREGRAGWWNYHKRRRFTWVTLEQYSGTLRSRPLSPEDEYVNVADLHSFSPVPADAG